MVEKKVISAQNCWQSRVWLKYIERLLQEFEASVVSVANIVHFPVNFDDCCAEPIQNTVHSVLEGYLVLETYYCNLSL